MNAAIFLLRLAVGKVAVLVALQIRNKDIPIRTYSVVHTGPKSQFGGENDGFSIVWYHVETDSEVKMEPITPAIKGAAIEIPKRRLSLL